ncbi:hypothetical protein Voc01_089640 [Virgisporangium ochraceum]|uniref:Uncharacterized protein n=1 Tax=Virgisporangium ochraceum TaxID=65505 RepID=A0A8J4A3V6_9ACTN|nr:hypothetical protein Voc01_089640 [Virgisporangium ochraceum]
MVPAINVGGAVTMKEADRFPCHGDVTVRIAERPSVHLQSGRVRIPAGRAGIASDDGALVGCTTLVRTAALRPAL